MLGYFAAIAVALGLARWGSGALRRSRSQALASPRNQDTPGLLRTVARLIGPRFDDDPGDDPQSMGEPLARALGEGLRARGFAAEGPCAGSYGYGLDVPIEGRIYAVSCGVRGGAEPGDESEEWVVFVKQRASPRSAEQPTGNSENARKLVGALGELFSALPAVRSVQWHADDEAFLRGDESWHPTPF